MIENTQCPICNFNIPPTEDHCPNCGNWVGSQQLLPGEEKLSYDLPSSSENSLSDLNNDKNIPVSIEFDNQICQICGAIIPENLSSCPKCISPGIANLVPIPEAPLLLSVPIDSDQNGLGIGGKGNISEITNIPVQGNRSVLINRKSLFFIPAIIFIITLILISILLVYPLLSQIGRSTSNVVETTSRIPTLPTIDSSSITQTQRSINLLGKYGTSEILALIPSSTSTLNPTQTQTPIHETETISPIDDMQMVFVPAGVFFRGSTTEDLSLMHQLCKECDPTSFLDQSPQHQIYLNDFWIDRTEVTNAQFTRFVEATGYITTAELKKKSYVQFQGGREFQYIVGAYWRHPSGPDSDIVGKEDYAVTQISWDDAYSYCKWAGRRLPTEAEWEKAARGVDKRLFPWGSEMPNPSLLNFNYNFDGPIQVGSYLSSASVYGALDMAGNVWEWVNDYYSQYYYDQAPDKNPSGPNSGEGRVFRGGSWASEYTGELFNVSTTYRLWNYSYIRSNVLGIRCASNLSPSSSEIATPFVSIPTPELKAVEVQLTATITPTFTPATSDLNGEWVAFAYGNNRNRLDLFIRNVITGLERQLTSNTTLEESPVFSPDGGYLAYTSCRPDCDLFLMDLRDFTEEQITNNSFRAKFPDYCRDPTKPWIVFEGRQERDQSEIWLVDLSTKKSIQLTNGVADLRPSFSPDCSQVAFLRANLDTDGNGEINTNDRSDVHIVEITSKEIQGLIITPEADEISLAWSPDGKWIALSRISRDSDGNGLLTLNDQSDLILFNLTEKDERNLTTGSFSAFSPAWSSDGNQLVFSNFIREGQQELWFYSLDNKQFTQFTRSGPYYHPAWAP